MNKKETAAYLGICLLCEIGFGLLMKSYHPGDDWKLPVMAVLFCVAFMTLVWGAGSLILGAIFGDIPE